MKKHEHNPAAGTALIIIILLIVFGGMLYWMYSVKLIILPESVAGLLGIGGKDSSGSLPWDTGELSGAIKNGKSSDKVELTFDITYENLYAALMSEPESEGLLQRYRISYYDNGAKISRRITLHRYGDKFRVEKYAGDSGDSLESLIIADSNTIYYLDNLRGDSRSIPRGAEITPESEAGLPSVDSLLAVLAEIQESETSEEITVQRYYDCELTMLRTADGIVYYAAFSDDALGLREEYYISLEYRMILKHQTKSGSKTIYSCEILYFYTDPTYYSNEAFYTPK